MAKTTQPSDKPEADRIEKDTLEDDGTDSPAVRNDDRIEEVDEDDWSETIDGEEWPGS